MEYFVHNGFIGWSYGTIGNPQLITGNDALELMKQCGLTLEEISVDFSPAQFAEKGEPLSELFGGTRFLQYGDIEKCADKKKTKISVPLNVEWNKI